MAQESSEKTVSSKSNSALIAVIGVIILAGIGGAAYLSSRQTTAPKPMMAANAPRPSGMMKPTGMMRGRRGQGYPPMNMTPQPTPTLTTEQQTQLQNGLLTTTTQKKFNITGGNFYFAPNEITVNKGDTVTFVMTDAGGIHDLQLPDFNVKTDKIQTGQQASVQFVADKTGTFEYYCSVGQHRQLGMTGKLTVK